MARPFEVAVQVVWRIRLFELQTRRAIRKQRSFIELASLHQLAPLNVPVLALLHNVQQTAHTQKTAPTIFLDISLRLFLTQ